VKTLAIVLVLTLSPVAALARGGDMGAYSLAGFYGLGFVNPSDINGLSSALGTTPAVGNMSSDSYYGGSLAFMMGWRWDLKFMYDQHDAKNYTNTSVNPNTGFEIQESNVWGMLDYYLIHTRSAYMTLGAGAGYPTNFHVTEQAATTTQFSAASNLNYIGQATIGIMLGSHFSIYFDGGYQRIISGNLTDPSNNILKNTSGAAAVADLSGFRADAGIRIHL